MRRANSEYVCMYVCMFELQTYPKHVCMHVWQPQASMYVCMSEAPEHVCLYVSLKPTKSACFGGCQIPHEKRSVFDHQFNFLRFVRGGTSRSLARRQTCMYVCLSSRPTLSMYVCTSDRPKQVCMYVWGSWACMYVSLTQSYKISVFRRVSNSLSKPFKIWRLIHVFLNCEGGYFQEPS